jgi:hypothetical protein
MIIAALTLYANAAFGQTASDIKTKYGKPLNVYSVSEHIWMTPEFDAEGQICMARPYPKRISAYSNYYFNRLPSDELKDVLNQLVPPSARGAKEYKSDFALSELGGGIERTTYPFEKVTFTFLLSFTVGPIKATDATKGEGLSLLESDFPLSQENPANKMKSGDAFTNASAPDPEIVEIWWKDRKCIGR